VQRRIFGCVTEDLIGGKGLRLLRIRIMELRDKISFSNMRRIRPMVAEIKKAWRMSMIGNKYRLETWKRRRRL
jgi:hypothetical protein